ncbi:4Fe-4S binding protein [Tumebacillus permanentifrigoris]|uniref:4Fe-4S binding protein n=1 Tax=Tumebacillus permanentifrigoris TaxID=378543 RepID=A0A316D8T4_9BACL|nr:4Fe-4S binding protein [Tumebacillus permanentifrigoris]PWK13379.1 4Fe-4S binding protein [Tumebacillus permanentifrigoris]
MNLRKSIGWWIIGLFFLVPDLNLFRLDLHSGHYYWMTKRLSYDQPLPLLLTILLLVFLVLGLSTFRARLFCTALCPHNTLSKGLRWLEQHRLDQPVAIVMTPLIAFTLVSYFYEPHDAWRGIVYAESPMALAFFAVLCVFLGWLLLRLRSKFCQHACPYGFFQHLFTPANPTRLAKTLVALVLVLLAGGMTVAALRTSRSEVSLQQLSRVQTGQSMTYVYKLGLTNNNRKSAELFTIKFDPAGPQPIGAGIRNGHTVNPGATEQLTFALRTTELATVQFAVCAQREGICKPFSTTLSGP